MRYVKILIFLVLVGGVWGGFWLSTFNHFSGVERSFGGQCTPVTGIAGPEDMQLDAPNRRVFISSLDRRERSARGGIYLFNVDDPLDVGNWRDRTAGQPEAFKPLGLDYYDDGEVRRLFVVNTANTAVEVFEVRDDGSLIHLETFDDPRLTSPNNVVAVGPRSFYVTNDVHPGKGTVIGNLHFLMRQPSGEVYFVDGDHWRMAADGLRFANGIEISEDGARVFVAETAGEAVRIYDRNPGTGALTLAETIDLKSAPDNIFLDENGDLWAAAMPKPLALPSHGRNPKNLVPSEVIRITQNGDAQSVYRDTGEELSASTSAARLGNTLLIGTLYDRKFLICDLPRDLE